MWAINALLQKTHLTSSPNKTDTNTTTTTTSTDDTNKNKSNTGAAAAASPRTTLSLSSTDAAAAEARLARAREEWQRQHFGGDITTQKQQQQQQQHQQQQQQQQQQQDEEEGEDSSFESGIGGVEVGRADVIFSLLATDGQIHVKEPHAVLVVHRVADFDYCMTVLSGSGSVSGSGSSPRSRSRSRPASRPLVSCPLSGGSRLSFDPVAHTLVWTLCVVHDSITVVQAFHVRYRNVEQEMEISRIIQQALVEHQHQMPFQKAVQSRDADWLYSAFDDAPHGSRDEKSDMELDFEQAPRAVINIRKTLGVGVGVGVGGTTRDQEEEEEEEEEEQDDQSDDQSEEDGDERKHDRKITSSYTPMSKRSQGKTHNSQLAVGIVENRTFVGRGATLGVFSHDSDGVLHYLNRIPTVRTVDGDAFTPTQLMLQQQDAHMCMLNPDQKTKVYDMDLHRGQIVQEYGVSDEFSIRHIAAPSKYGEAATDTTVAGVNNNTIFSLDPRLNTKSKLAHKFQYASGPGMTCLATTGDGHIAVGSEKGEIRMFSQIGQKAKTLLPGLGDPIISLDVTEDGHWILATTRRYLLVIPTELQSGKTGFTTPMGNQEKPAPIKLQLDPRDLLRYNITDVSFSGARFNTGSGISERWIVTSTGNYLITWNFSSVKKNIRSDYKIKSCQQQVISDQFLYGRDDQLVVTEQDNVYLQPVTTQQTRNKK